MKIGEKGKEISTGLRKLVGGGREGKRTQKNKGKKWVLFTGLILIALIAGALFWQRHSRNAKPAGARAEAGKTATVTRGTLISELSSSGTIKPKDTYNVTSLVEGEVLSANFEEGDQVTKDQILYKIDSSSMETELKSAGNSLERAEKNYQKAVEDYEEAVSDYSGNTYKSTRTGFIRSLNIEAGDKVGSNTQIAEIYNDRLMKLRVPFLSQEAVLIAAGMQGTITLSDTGEQLFGTVTAVSNMDEVLDGGRLVRYVTLEVENPGGLTSQLTAGVQIGEYLSSAEASFEAITNTVMNVSLSGNSSVEVEAVLVHEGDYVTVGTPVFRIRSKDVADILDSFQNSVDSAEASLEQAQTKVESTQDNYDNYTIKAPISGQVIKKNVRAGENISRGSNNSDTTLAVIYDLTELTFEMSIDELDVQKVQVGQKVEVTADACEGKIFSGTVTNISLESSQSNGVTNYPVTVTLEEAGELLPGMNVDGVIILDEVENTLMVPVDALMRGNRVYVKDDSVKEAKGSVPAGYRAVEVEVGLSSDDYVEIKSGLEEGDVIYVDESSAGTVMFPMGGMGGPGGNRGGPGGNGGMRGNGGGPGGMP